MKKTNINIGPNITIDLADSRRKKRNKKILFFVTFLTALLVSAATYAWLSSSLNVKIRFFEMKVQSDSGLFISLDGIDFSDAVTISVDSVIVDLKKTYPNHINQWAAVGLWPVSTNGIKNSNTYMFDVYQGHLLRTRFFNPNGSIKRILNTIRLTETAPNSTSAFISFDVFLKNASGSPKSDNLYFESGTGIFYEENTPDDIKETMDGILHSARIGIVKVGDVPHKTSPSVLQNLQCNNNCQMVIYEPYSTRHSKVSIKTAENYGITLVDGVYIPSYGIINEGERLEHTSGHLGTGLPLRVTHFAEQKTIKSFEEPIFEIPNGLSKYRVYVWIEGQDVDSLETFSPGTGIDIAINLMKDLAGYE